MNTTKIVVTFSGHNDDEMNAEINSAKNNINDFDIVEIRGDVYDALNREDHTKNVQHIIETFKPLNKEIIYTYRSTREGGSGSKTTIDYEALLSAICQTMDIDYIDIELHAGDEIVTSICEIARKNNIECLLSHHNFKLTPQVDEILATIEHMNVLGGDLYKVAYFPHEHADVKNVLTAVERAKENYGDKIIGISMSEIGKITRKVKGKSASAFTYGFIRRDAAPGQIHITELRKTLSDLS